MHDVIRKFKGEILQLLQQFPAVALLGPRQCGKTTLAFQIQTDWPQPSRYLDLENVTDLAKLDDCVAYLQPLEDELVVIDEVQSRPGLFPEIRGLIDEGRRRGRRSGRFLFLGSASYELLKQSGESLAGRIAYRELTPFRVDEIAAEKIDTLWLRGGFPDSFLAKDDAASSEWRRNFVDTYLTRDLNMHGRVDSLPSMRNLLQMSAHLHGQVLNISQLMQSHEFSRQQINNYLDLFDHTFVIRRLPPYFKNIGKRLTKRPKVYLRDCGILHQLLNIKTTDTLQGHPMRGVSWEGFVIEQIIALLPEWQPHFYRTSNGAELDLLMLQGDRILAFEVKASVVAKLTKGFHTARADVEPHTTYLVSRTDETWTTGDGLIRTNLRDLPELLAPYG